MAEKVQFNTTITAEMRETLRQAAQERGCVQGDLIEAALAAFLVPEAHAVSRPIGSLTQEALTSVVHQLRVLEEAQTALSTRLDTMGTTVAAIPDTLEDLIAPVGAYLMALEEAIKVLLERCDTLLTRVPAPPPPKPPDPPQRIATYEAMYGPPETWVDPYPMPSSPPLDPPKRGLLARLFLKEV
jgi:hypothetical protein